MWKALFLVSSLLGSLMGADATTDAPASMAALESGIARRQIDIDAIDGKTCNSQSVGKKLLAMRNLDQFVRGAFYTVCQKGDQACDEKIAEDVSAVDETNIVRLKNVLSQYPWGKLITCSPSARSDAWLIAQHADQYPEFQAQILKSVERAFLHGQTSGEDYAYLYDRVSWHLKRPQRFGTQGACNGGRWNANPIEKPEQLDRRRSEIGLDSEESYQDVMNKICSNR